MVVNAPPDSRKPCEVPLASVKTPTICPVALIARASVRVAAGASMTVKPPSVV